VLPTAPIRFHEILLSAGCAGALLRCIDTNTQTLHNSASNLPNFQSAQLSTAPKNLFSGKFPVRVDESVYASLHESLHPGFGQFEPANKSGLSSVCVLSLVV
jgi:hypothetical protein